MAIDGDVLFVSVPSGKYCSFYHATVSIGMLLTARFALLPRDAMLAWYMLSSSVHPSVTRRYCTKMANCKSFRVIDLGRACVLGKPIV